MENIATNNQGQSAEIAAQAVETGNKEPAPACKQKKPDKAKHTWLEKSAVAIAVLAFLATAWQGYISNDTEKRTLRAYVGMFDHQIKNVAINDTPHVLVVIKNFDSTPASNVTYWIQSKFDRYPNPIDFPVQPFKPDKVVLFPTDAFTVALDIEALNEVDMAGLNEGSRPLYVYGEINYWDAFNNRRCTRFRLM